MPAGNERFLELLMAAREEHPVIGFELPLEDVCILIANLQLALRHPQNRGAGRDHIRDLTDGLIALFDGELAELLRRGDDPAYWIRPEGGSA